MIATTLQRQGVTLEPARPVRQPVMPHHGVTLDLQNLGKSFGANPVLRGIDLKVPAGQFLAVVGRSGCGKSTLLRLLVGLDRPSIGQLLISGRPATAGVARIMFQEPRLLPWARVLANVEVGLTPVGGAAERRAQALQLLAQVGLADRARDWPAVLSGGQRQRVALARALASEPRLLALDEPLGALDALTRIEMQDLLAAIWQQQRFTAVLVTHDVAEALALADRVIVIEGGRIALDLDVPLARPRQRGSAELAALEGRILDQLLAPGRGDHR